MIFFIWRIPLHVYRLQEKSQIDEEVNAVDRDRLIDGTQHVPEEVGINQFKGLALNSHLIICGYRRESLITKTSTCVVEKAKT